MALADIAINIITKGAELAKRQLKGVGDSGDKSSKGIDKLSTAMKAGLVASAVAVGKALAHSTRQFMAFDDAMTQSLAIMNTNEEQQKAMAMTAREVATTTRISAEQGAEAFFFLASAGLNAEQSISALPQVAAFAQAGMFDMATATDLATDAQSALGLTVDDAQQNLANLTRVTDVLVKGNTLANASVQQFSEALTNKAGAALKVVNKSIEEGVAVLAVFADRGVKGAEAGEKLNQLLRDIPRAVAKNKEEFEALGLQMFDSNGKMRNVADIVQELDRVLGPMSDELKASTLDQLGLNRGVADAVKILSGAPDEIRAYEEALSDSGGTTQEVAEKQMGSLQAQTDIMKAKFNELALVLGEQLAPMLETVIGGISRLLDIAIEGTKAKDEYSDATKLMAEALGIEESQVMSMNNSLNEQLMLEQKQRRAKEELARQTVDYFEKLHFQSLVEKDLIANAHELDRETGTLNRTKQESIELTEEEIEAEAKLAEERKEKSLGALQKVLRAYKKIQSIQQNIIDLENEEKEALEKLNKSKQKETALTNQRDLALQELKKQQELSKQVTLEEELAIIRANEALAKAQEQLDGTRAKQIEYELAQKAVTQAIEDSTSATSAEQSAKREYQRALDELERQMEKTKEAQKEYQESQERLAKATERSTENILQMAIAKKELDEAIADAKAIGALEEGLTQMVDLVGGKLSDLKKQFEDIFDLSGKSINMPTTSGNKGGGGGGSTKYDTSGSNATGDLTPPGRFDFTLGQRGGVTTINNIQVAVEGALTEKTGIQDAVAIALIEAQKRGTKVIL